MIQNALISTKYLLTFIFTILHLYGFKRNITFTRFQKKFMETHLRQNIPHTL